MNGNGKIARLPRAIGEELNQRLDDNQSGGRLLSWLNGLEPVRNILSEHFGGVPVSKQNLSEWRTGGFKRWQSQRELLEQARDMAADASDLSAVTDGRLTEHLATVLSARYAAVLSGWSGEMGEDLRQQLRMLSGMCRDIVALRRGDFHSARLKMEQEAADREREKTEEEMITYFERWLQNPEVMKLLSKELHSESDITQRRRGAKVRAGRATGKEESKRVKANPENCGKQLRRIFKQQPVEGEQETVNEKTQKRPSGSNRVKPKN